MKIDNRAIYNSAGLCATYLINSIQEDGSFIYEVNAQTGTISKDYNILRHAGSLYVLYQSLPLKLFDSPALSIMEKGMAFLESKVMPLKENGSIGCVVEGGEAKLGGAGLALLAMAERYRTTSNKNGLAIMRQLASFIVYMQKSDGSFRSKMLYEENQHTGFHSVYYPGEAILGLVMLHVIDPDPAWLRAAEIGSDYLVANPVQDRRLERGHNHWFAMALSELYFQIPKKEYREELGKIVHATVISSHANIFGLPGEAKAKRRFSSAAMATRGEAIMAGIVLETRLKNSRLVDEWMPVIWEILSYCIGLQIGEGGEFNVNMLGGIKSRKKNYLVRIDFVQHSMAVMVSLLKLHT